MTGTVTATSAGAGQLNTTLKVYVLTGGAFTQNGATGSSSALTTSLTPVGTGSVLLLPEVLGQPLRDGAASRGWGIVISTDTAFLLGALALVGPRRGARLRVFLLTLAVADDMGALIVIALRYTAHLHWIALGCAVAGFVVIAGLRRLQAWRGVSYAVVAIATWVALYESGVQPTLAGVLIALILPVYPPQRQEVERAGKLPRDFEHGGGQVQTERAAARCRRGGRDRRLAAPAADIQHVIGGGDGRSREQVGDEALVRSTVPLAVSDPLPGAVAVPPLDLLRVTRARLAGHGRPRRHCGLRFSRNACIPSCASGSWLVAAITSTA